MPTVLFEAGESLADLELEVLVDPEVGDPDQQELELYEALTNNTDELRTIATEAVAQWVPGMIVDVAIERGSPHDPGDGTRDLGFLAASICAHSFAYGSGRLATDEDLTPAYRIGPPARSCPCRRSGGGALKPSDILSA